MDKDQNKPPPGEKEGDGGGAPNKKRRRILNSPVKGISNEPVLSRGRLLLEMAMAKKRTSEKASNADKDREKSKRVRFGNDGDDMPKDEKDQESMDTLFENIQKIIDSGKPKKSTPQLETKSTSIGGTEKKLFSKKSAISEPTPQTKSTSIRGTEKKFISKKLAINEPTPQLEAKSTSIGGTEEKLISKKSAISEPTPQTKSTSIRGTEKKFISKKLAINEPPTPQLEAKPTSIGGTEKKLISKKSATNEKKLEPFKNVSLTKAVDVGKSTSTLGNTDLIAVKETLQPADVPTSGKPSGKGIPKEVGKHGKADGLENTNRTPIVLEQLQDNICRGASGGTLSEVDNNIQKPETKKISASPKKKSFFAPVEKMSVNNSHIFHGIGPTEKSAPLEGERVEGNAEFDMKSAVDALDTECYDILKDCFETIFTFLAYKLGLQPKDHFTFERHKKFGLIPVFGNEESQEYVEEVSKSAVLFTRKGVLDGAVFHVNMLNRHRVPITQTRFVFRPRGRFFADRVDVKDTSRTRKTRDKIRSMMVSMVKSISDLKLDELECPWFSQWSISLGLKKDFIHSLRQSGHTGPLGPFTDHPSADFFPWKKRPRLSQAVKLGLINFVPNIPDGNLPPGVTKTLEKKAPQPKTPHINIPPGTVANKTLEKPRASPKKQTERFANLKSLSEKIRLSNSSLYSPVKDTSYKLPEWEYFSSSEDEDTEDPHRRAKKAIPKQKLVMETVFSQEILPQLVMLIYQIEYTKSKIQVDEKMKNTARDEQMAHEALLKFSD